MNKWVKKILPVAAGILSIFQHPAANGCPITERTNGIGSLGVEYRTLHHLAASSGQMDLLSQDSDLSAWLCVSTMFHIEPKQKNSLGKFA